jgi:hypothetical protein
MPELRLRTVAVDPVSGSTVGLQQAVVVIGCGSGGCARGGQLTA